MEFKEISLKLSFVRSGVSPSIFIFSFGEIRYTIYGIHTIHKLVKISERQKVLLGTRVF